jgi:subtilase family serine protease
VLESQETNNTYTRLIRIGPDLGVSSLTLPTSIRAGSVMSVTDVTLNQGGAGAAPSTTAYYLSADIALGAGDVLLGTRAIPALAAGTSDAATLTVTVPASTPPGTYYVIARADAADGVTEALETNNTYVRTIQVTAP